MLRTGIAVQQPSRQLLPCQGADPSGHPGSSHQACEWGRRGSTDHPVSPSMPTCSGSTTHRSRSSSSGEIRIVHVSEKSVPPADVTSRADGPAEVANPAQLADPADTASPPDQRLPTRHRRAARLQPAARVDPAGVAGPSQDQSGDGPHSVSMPHLIPGYNHPPLDQMPVTHQCPADNPDVSVDSGATIFPSIPKYVNQIQLIDFITMMNIAQHKGQSRDQPSGPATVSTPRAVVRKSPSPLPARHVWDRTPERSRSPVRESLDPQTRTDCYSFKGSDSSSCSRSSHSSRSPDRRPDSPLDFRAAIQAEETENGVPFYGQGEIWLKVGI